MATNLIQNGDVLTLPAPTGGTTSGTGVLVGSIFGIASSTVDAGDDVAVNVTGVWEHAKTSAQAWTVGAAIYWDDTNKVFTTSSSGNTLVGKATVAAANPSDTGTVRLNG